MRRRRRRRSQRLRAQTTGRKSRGSRNRAGAGPFARTVGLSVGARVGESDGLCVFGGWERDEERRPGGERRDARRFNEMALEMQSDRSRIARKEKSTHQRRGRERRALRAGRKRRRGSLKVRVRCVRVERMNAKCRTPDKIAEPRGKKGRSHAPAWDPTWAPGWGTWSVPAVARARREGKTIDEETKCERAHNDQSRSRHRIIPRAALSYLPRGSAWGSARGSSSGPAARARRKSDADAAKSKVRRTEVK